ncbi:MAG TPA: iron-containing redox enzyme family protein [Nocardioides sp.]|nr:iron-containing redox enzyme family protein [Nocardioides sp.]
MLLPKPRGAYSQSVFAHLRMPTEPLPQGAPDDLDDESVTLWALHELHYRGFDDVDDRREWDPAVLGVRRLLEDRLEDRLRDRWPGPPTVDGDWVDAFFAHLDAVEGPSLARFVQREAGREQVLDLLRWRSVYHLKEADPTTWALPRLPTAAKAALAEIQFDEYGAGDPNRLHAHLFARGLEGVGLRSEYGAYVDETPWELLEQNNALSLLGLQRRLRGAALGHFAAFEATSSLPSRWLVQGLERLGLGGPMSDYYAEHVEADAVHEQLAVRGVLLPLLAVEPTLADDVWFGAWTSQDLEIRTARRVLGLWGVAA